MPLLFAEGSKSKVDRAIQKQKPRPLFVLRGVKHDKSVGAIVAGARILGRNFDRPTVKTIVTNVAQHDYRFSSLVLEIVNSLPFQMQRKDRGKT